MDWFSPIDPSKKNSEFIAVESKSFWKAAWGRFKKNPMAVLGLVVILLLAVVSIFGPMISPYAYDAQDAANQYAGFSAQHIFGTDKFGRDVFTRLCYGGRISLAIDVYISDDYMDVLADGVWEQFFTVKPEPLTREERQAWLKTLDGVSLGSDAFFPFGDNIERAHRSGVQYIAQPGGSIRDDHVIDTCNRFQMAMAFTGIRLFHH